MATRKFNGRSTTFNKINIRSKKCTGMNKRVDLDGLMAILVERQRAAVCLRGKGVPDDQAAQCGCPFCSPEAQREKFGATIEEMDAQFSEEAALATARRKTRYVRGMLAYERARHDRRKSAAIRGR
ncbi:hypothetical protein [Aquabacterium sp.]|uniref:hypothetical protein n=1 Tax=Aquabacterium sp. TaxID=1872578 RepID=UPI00260CC354|nr:hypothetical protein [Aquabacterium sp.]MDD2978065.1 hypothetical protein [Aquabacterium sp.]